MKTNYQLRNIVPKRIISRFLLFLLMPMAPIFSQSISPVVVSSMGDKYPNNSGPQSITAGESMIDHYAANGLILTTGFQQPMAYTAPITTMTSISSPDNSSVTMPVTVMRCVKIKGLKLRIDYDHSLLTYNSYSSANSQLTGMTVTNVHISGQLYAVKIEWSGATAKTIADYGKLVDLNFTYTSGTANLTFNNVSDPTNYCQYTDSTGAVMEDKPDDFYYRNGKIHPPLTISGNFEYNNSANTALDAVSVTLKKDNVVSGTTTTGVGGAYSFSNVANGQYTITATTSKAWAGINATDALKVERHFAGFEILTEPVSIQAADVNNSDGINATDALQIKQRFLGLISSFNRGNWTFAEPTSGGASVIVSDASITQDFFGLCVGDVNGSNVPGPGKSSASQINLLPDGEITILADQEFDLPVWIKSSEQVGALSMILEFSPDLFRVQDVTMPSQKPLYKVNGNQIRIAWSNPEPLDLDKDDILLNIKMKLTGPVDLKYGVSLTSLDGSELADGWGHPLSGITLSTLLIKTVHSQGQLPDSRIISSCRIYPNPASGYLNLEFGLTRETPVTVSITGLAGNQVLKQSLGRKDAGLHHVKMDVSSLPDGLYFFSVETAEGIPAEIHRVVITR